MASELPERGSTAEDEVWSAIAAFEHILAAMPNDVGSLTALSHAYMQIGDHSRAIDYFVRLGNVLLDERDIESAVELLDKLQRYEHDERVLDLAARIRAEEGGGTESEEVARAADEPVYRAHHADLSAISTFRIAEELSLAWHLMESEELSQDEYASVVQDLSEMSASAADATASVLHVLEARGFKSLDRIIGSLCRESGLPFVSLSSYEFQFGVSRMLPPEFVIARGALCFDQVGSDLLVAVLNPMDSQLRIDVEFATERRCHFFIAMPSEFDVAAKRYVESMSHVGPDGELQAE